MSNGFIAVVVSSFDPPEGKAPYSYVFDFTGETKPDRSEPVSINSSWSFHANIKLGIIKDIYQQHFPSFEYVGQRGG